MNIPEPILDESNPNDSVLQQKINTIINILTLYCGKPDLRHVKTRRLQQTFRMEGLVYYSYLTDHFIFRYKYAWWPINYSVTSTERDRGLRYVPPYRIRLTIFRERPYFWQPYVYPEVSFNTDTEGNLSIDCEPTIKDKEIKKMLDTLYSECLAYRQKVTTSISTKAAEELQASLDKIEAKQNAKTRGNRLTKLFEQ